jgi:hypothetical protein
MPEPNDHTVLDTIEDPTLLTNAKQTIDYIVYLIDLADGLEEGRPKSFHYKTCIVFTASIIELVIHDFLRRTDSSKLNKFKLGWQTKHPQDIYKIDDNQIIVWAKKEKQFFQLKDNSDFQDIIEAMGHLNVINDTLKGKCHEIRNLRNKIHLQGIKRREPYYKIEDVDHALETLTLIRNAIVQQD